MKIKLAVMALLAAVVLAAGTWLVVYIYGRLRDESEAQAINAMIQAALALATIFLVAFTLWQVSLTRKANEQTARNSLRGRLDARGPRAAVHFWDASASLEDTATQLRIRTTPPNQPETSVTVRDGDTIDTYVLTLTCMFEVRVFGNEPVLAAIAPGSLADEAPHTFTVIEPNTRHQTVRYAKTVHGDEIRQLAERGLPNAKGLWEFWKVVVVVADHLRTVKDDYYVHLDWWPFERIDGGWRIWLHGPDARPRVVGAHRRYDPEGRLDP